MSSVDVVPLGDTRRHHVPEGYNDVRQSTAWVVLPRRIDGLFPPCWCNPEIDPVIRGEELGAIYTHHARDGREAAEREAA